MDTQSTIAIPVPVKSLVAFCQQWHIRELALFGSVLRPDFRPGSDVDVLVTFTPDRAPTLEDRTSMQQELSALFGHPVDLVYRRVIERDSNYLLRRSILNSAQVIYAA